MLILGCKYYDYDYIRAFL